jgi:hypothetical protein
MDRPRSSDGERRWLLHTSLVAAGSAAVLAAVTLGACGSTTERSTTAATSRPGAPPAFNDGDFDRRNFTDPTKIDNQWFPLTPGTQFIFVGKADRGDGLERHRVVFTVTDLTKVIDGVRTRVLWDRDYNAGQLEEGELTFHAQDDDGTVWNFGEYPEEWDGRKLVGAPDTWIAGLAEARAGILMQAAPRVGTSSYLQGWAPAIDFADRARVLHAGQRTCVPVDCYRHVLVTDEWNPAEPGAHQRKYYARGIGTIRVGSAGRDKEREGLVLQKVIRLDAQAMVAVRRGALKLERRAYAVRKDLYGHTPPAERTTKE